MYNIMLNYQDVVIRTNLSLSLLVKGIAETYNTSVLDFFGRGKSQK